MIYNFTVDNLLSEFSSTHLDLNLNSPWNETLETKSKVVLWNKNHVFLQQLISDFFLEVYKYWALHLQIRGPQNRLITLYNHSI